MGHSSTRVRTVLTKKGKQLSKKVEKSNLTLTHLLGKLILTFS